jgi:transcriptional regulator with XRE-family HTH domain
LPLAKALRQFGADIKDARRRRRISVSVMAERASISRVTLNKIEKGDPRVVFGSYAMVLFILGLTDKLSSLVDIKHDDVGLELSARELPIRIRKPWKRINKKKE